MIKSFGQTIERQRTTENDRERQRTTENDRERQRTTPIILVVIYSNNQYSSDNETTIPFIW
jgi:hypothetical protein